MQRRQFITLLCGAATWPLAAHAQQAAMPTVGFLRSAPVMGFQDLVTPFRQGLREAGYVEGQNVAVEYRFANDAGAALRALAVELIQHPVAVLVGDNLAALAAKAATATVPIVFASGGDPVRNGLVASLNRPGGNVTGVSFFSGELGSKRLELLRQLAPKASAIAVLMNPNTPTTEAERRDVQAAAQAIGQPLIILEAASDKDIDNAFATISKRRPGALLVGSGTFLNARMEAIIALAARNKLPAIYYYREQVVAGGLMGYGSNLGDTYRQTGIYAGRILKGEKPADLPVMRSTKFELVINLKTAKALGLKIPDQMLALADEVIE
jgi:putative ABC transport system substrate-binding protein